MDDESTSVESSKNQSSHGGKRTGAGRKAGKQNQETLERAAIKKAFQDRVGKVAQRLFDAQMNLAMGVSYLWCVDKDSKGNNLPAKRVTNPGEIEDYINGNLGDTDAFYYISTEKPDNRAIDSLLDRAFGRAEQNMKLTGDEDQPIPILSLIGGDVPRNNSSTEDSEPQ